MNANCHESCQGRMNAIPSYICAGLYVSDWRTACLADLEALRIGLVVTAMTAEELDYYGIEGGVDFEGAEWLWIAVDDDDAEPIQAHFDRVCEQIEKTKAVGKGVLIHCMAGVSRSPTLAAAWLMRRRGLAAAEALAYLKERRPCVDPNPGFRQQLLIWEQQLGGIGSKNLRFCSYCKIINSPLEKFDPPPAHDTSTQQTK